MLDPNKKVYLVYGSTKGIWPTSARDFSMIQETQSPVEGKSALNLTMSVEDLKVPPEDKKVRGEVSIAGWKINQVGNSCEVL